MITRRCKVCGLEKPLSELAPDKRSKYGHKQLCNVCAAGIMRQQRAKPNSRHKEVYKASRERLRNDIFTAYGNKCNICGQTQEIYLQIDHINGDGHKHRKESSPSTIYNDIRKEGYPKDKYQLLCANCHLAKTRGVNPHDLI